MKAGWVETTLGKICEIQNGNSISRKKKLETFTDQQEGLYYFGTKDVGYGEKLPTTTEVRIPKSLNGKFRVAPKGSSLICSEGGSAGRKFGYTDKDCHFGNKLFCLQASEVVEPKFIFYFLGSVLFREQFESKKTGLIGGVSKKKFSEIKINIPSLEEQKRIVKLLEQSLASLDKVRTNLEANRSDTKALFARALDTEFSDIQDHCVSTPLIEICEERGVTYGVIKLGDHLSDGVPCLRTSNIKPLSVKLDGLKKISPQLSQDYSRTILRGGEVLVSVRGTLGGAYVVPDEMGGWNISREVAMIDINPSLASPDFICQYLTSTKAQSWLAGVTVGAAYKGINLKDLRKLLVPLPSMDAQKAVASKISKFLTQRNRLSEAYNSQLMRVENLHQSLLLRAFEGDLTQAALTIPINDNEKSSRISTAVLILAYDKHLTEERHNTFGHVKAAKALHLTESIGNLDLGRRPKVRQAGPHDQEHFARVENWAAEHKAFSFEKRSSGGYTFKRGASYGEMLVEAKTLLADHAAGLSKFLPLMVDMSTEEAEVFTTVHAAWNNLLADGKTPSDEEIIYAAREGWHESKTNIAHSKFSDAIRLIRRHDLEPDGSAKYVHGAQTSLI